MTLLTFGSGGLREERENKNGRGGRLMEATNNSPRAVNTPMSGSAAVNAPEFLKNIIGVKIPLENGNPFPAAFPPPPLYSTRKKRK